MIKKSSEKEDSTVQIVVPAAPVAPPVSVQSVAVHTTKEDSHGTILSPDSKLLKDLQGLDIP